MWCDVWCGVVWCGVVCVCVCVWCGVVWCVCVNSLFYVVWRCVCVEEEGEGWKMAILHVRR